MTDQQVSAEPKPAPTAAAAPEPTPAAPETAPTSTSILPPEHWARLEAERNPDEDDSDSAFGDNASSTASLSSSILNFRTIHGRTYHSEQGNALYWAANDDAANESLDIIHHVLMLMLDGAIYRAPLSKDIQKVVDIGTGTGIWAIDFADQFPNADIVGTDVSPIQPSWVPPNVEFQIDDCTREWTFAENSLDYVHMRWLFGSIQDWDALYKQAYRCLKPGGYIESHEASVIFRSDDESVKEKSAMAQFGSFMVEGGKKMGRSTTIVEDGTQRKGIEAAGFVDIHEENYKTPCGTWPKDPRQKEIGTFQQLAVEQDTEGTMLYIASLLGWSRPEVQVFIAHMRREFRSKDIHGYYRQKIVYARKPAAT